jgi:hypothetical protein
MGEDSVGAAAGEQLCKVAGQNLLWLDHLPIALK